MQAAVYITAAVSSVGVELSALVRELAVNEGVLPKRYKNKTFLIVRGCFAFLAAGPLAIILGAHGLLMAFYVGVSAPLIFDRAAAGIKENGILGMKEPTSSDS